MALGCIHLSYDDFCRLEPEEFEEVWKAYNEKQLDEYKDSWNRMRMLATICIQPHVKKNITPTKLLPFSWDRSTHATDEPKLTKEEKQKRFKQLVEKLGEHV